MLIPKLSLVSISRNSTKVTLADSTGVYNVSTNPGGYGAPNIVSPPTAVGFTFRLWAADSPYLNFASQDAGLIANLVGVSGRELDAVLLGTGQFNSGVHHIKYYPFELMTTLVTLTNGSDIVDVVAGATPDTWDAGYVAVIFLDTNDLAVTNVRLISKKAISNFAIDTAWTGGTVTEYKVMLATEADLKVLFTGLANDCISKKIGDLVADNCSCDNSQIHLLTKLSLWVLAAKVKQGCKDYDGANSLITAAYNECNICESQTCKTCS